MTYKPFTDFSDMQAEQNAFKMTYDDLVIAVGAVPNTFGTPGVHRYAHFLKEIGGLFKHAQIS